MQPVTDVLAATDLFNGQKLTVKGFITAGDGMLYLMTTNRVIVPTFPYGPSVALDLSQSALPEEFFEFRRGGDPCLQNQWLGYATGRLQPSQDVRFGALLTDIEDVTLILPTPVGTETRKIYPLIDEAPAADI